MDNKNIRSEGARKSSTYTLIIGLWLVAAPFILRYSMSEPLLNDIIAGVAVSILAFIGTRATKTTIPRWFNLLIGFWLFISPFVLSYRGAEMIWNDLIFGLMIVAIESWGISAASSATLKHI